MSETTRKILFSCLAILVAACLCVGVIGLAGAGVFTIQPASPVLQKTPSSTPLQSQPLATQVISPTNPHPLEITPTVGPTPTQEPTASTPAPTQPTSGNGVSQSISPQVAQEMDRIQQEDTQIRGLQATTPITRALITQEQLKQKVTNDFFKDYTKQDAQNDALELSAFGFLQPNFDLYQFYVALYGEQVAGFYDMKTKEMYVIEGQGFNGFEKFTYAHEYEHALQDQNFNQTGLLNQDEATCKANSERCAAIQALAEGDATLTQLDWLSAYGTRQDYQDIQQASQQPSPVYDSAPDFIKKDFIFPYQQGETFVQYFYNQGGWPAVNQVFRNPPVSTEQILHPERYPNDQPVNVSLPDLTNVLGIGWKKEVENTLGEWYTYLMLGDGRETSWRLSDTSAQQAAAGWGGDEYVLYTNGNQQAVLAWRAKWDSASEASQFAAAFKDYASRRFGSQPDNQSGVLSWHGSSDEYSLFQLDQDQTTWVLAPDQTIAEKVWQNLP